MEWEQLRGSADERDANGPVLMHDCERGEHVQCHAVVDDDQSGGDIAGNVDLPDVRHGGGHGKQQLGVGEHPVCRSEFLALQQWSTTRDQIS
ncbi:MAG: hypothetical protein ACRELE_05970 [Gemmatimonadales bacterium]